MSDPERHEHMRRFTIRLAPADAAAVEAAVEELKRTAPVPRLSVSSAMAALLLAGVEAQR